jgi:predicted membrane-bound spermidine synthase
LYIFRLTFFAFLFITVFIISFGVILFELTLTRIFSIILWYDYAFMAISVAFFGLGIGSFVIYILKTRKKPPKVIEEKDKEKLFSTQIYQSSVAFAVSLPIFLIIVGYIIPPNTSFIYLFYIASFVPFFFAGMSLALMYLALPKEISKLYFVDLVGAAFATLLLDPFMQKLGAESTLLLLSIIITGSSLITALFLRKPAVRRREQGTVRRYMTSSESIMKLTMVCVIVVVSVLIFANTFGYDIILSIQPGETKILHQRLADPSIEHLETVWNSFSRIDVTQQTNAKSDNDPNNDKILASILIDADADTPVFRWNGSVADLQWLKEYMDFLPYEMADQRKVNDTLVIGSGGGGDVLVALAGGSNNVTAVELNPSILSTVRKFGEAAGNIYDRSEVNTFVDDGRRFISSSNSKYDMIVIKLVDSWAAQLAGGYALSENYLYTVEAFRQYLQHLDPSNGMLVMVRWNFELPRLMPLLIESLSQETGKSTQEISKQMMIVEDRPGLYFGSNPERTIYPVLVMMKNGPFTQSEIDVVNGAAAKNDAKVITIPGGHVEPPYDILLSGDIAAWNNLKNNNTLDNKHPLGTINWQEAGIGLKLPTDDSPFYFAKEPIPRQMVILLETVLILSLVSTALLIYYARLNRVSSSGIIRFHILFVIFIGLGFMFLEITFIQKFLLLLGTPIMALTVILFSILLSTGIGSYLSGKLFNNNPYKGIIISIPVLVGIVLIYHGILPEIITSSMTLELSQSVALTIALLFPVGIVMGFQFPSIVRMAYSINSTDRITEQYENSKIVTVLWGANVIASVVGTVLAAIFSMVVGFNGNLLIAAGFYLAALCSVGISVKRGKNLNNMKEKISQL